MSNKKIEINLPVADDIDIDFSKVQFTRDYTG